MANYPYTSQVMAQQAADTKARLDQIQAQAQAQQYQASLHQNQHYISMGSGGGTAGSGGIGGLGTLWTATASPSVTWTTVNAIVPTTNTLLTGTPHPNLSTVSMAFVQSNGITITIDVDASMVAGIQSISDYHAKIIFGACQAVTPKHQPMVEGDFSLDEMEQAEKVMEDLHA